MTGSSRAKLLGMILLVGLLWLADRVLDLGLFRGEAPSSASRGTGAAREAPAPGGGPGTAEASKRTPQATLPTGGTLGPDDDETVRTVRRAKRSDAQVEIRARVSKLLPDDDDTPRHQRFLLGLSDGSTVLVAHNLDLAPRVPVDKGSIIRAFGEFEWNEKGGVLHWTHKDPKRRHPDGWIEVDGRRYQ